MDALTLLLQRRSIAKLIEPAPTGQALETILRAGLRVPDHGHLTPWRFVVIEGEGRQRLSDLFQSALKEEGASDFEIDKVAKAPFRAPMIITVIAACKEHAKVPQWEQVVSAGCAVQAMQMAAVAQGFSGIWRTGSWASHVKVREAFQCQALDQIVGFLYLGTPAVALHPLHEVNIGDFVSYF